MNKKPKVQSSTSRPAFFDPSVYGVPQVDQQIMWGTATPITDAIGILPNAPINDVNEPNLSYKKQLKSTKPSQNGILNQLSQAYSKSKSILNEVDKIKTIEDIRKESQTALTSESHYINFLSHLGLRTRNFPDFYQVESIDIDDQNNLIVTEKPQETSDSKLDTTEY